MKIKGQKADLKKKKPQQTTHVNPSPTTSVAQLESGFVLFTLLDRLIIMAVVTATAVYPETTKLHNLNVW